MLNISKNIYAAWSTSGREPLPEAEIIPIGNSSNEKRKLKIVSNKYHFLKEIENKPLPGFTLYKSNRKSWGSSDQTWLVIDPRGFLARISNENLQEILQISGITEGLIQERCVWARENTETKMSLIPVNSKKYIEAIENTELLDSKITSKMVNIGDTVLIQQHDKPIKGIYMGNLSLFGSVADQRRSELSIQCFLNKQVLQISNSKYYYQSNFKFLKILEKSDSLWKPQDLADLMNDSIEQNSIFFSSSYYPNSHIGPYGFIKHVSIDPNPTVKMTLEEIDLNEASRCFYQAYNNSEQGILLLEKDDQYFIINFLTLSQNNYTINNFPVYEILKPENEFTKLTIKIYHYPRGRTHYSKLSDFKKFYKIIKHVNDKTFI